MIEPVMYLSIGFLLACLISIAFMPLVHARATRLTVKRMEASIPMSMAEIQADRDRLRAQFAMAIRQLEISVGQLQAKTSSQAMEIGKKTAAINRMRAELDSRIAAYIELEAREKALADQLHVSEEKYASEAATAKDLGRRLAIRESEIDRMSRDFSNHQATIDRGRMELISLQILHDTQKLHIASDARKIRELQERLERADAEAARSDSVLQEQKDLREKVERELDNLKREIDAGRTSEIIEQALLRERIESIAIDVTKLALTMEGYDAPTQTLLADAAKTSSSLAEQMSRLQKYAAARR